MGTHSYYYQWHGETLSVADIAQRIGVTPNTLHGRLKRHGYDIVLCTDGWQDYISTPARQRAEIPEKKALRQCCESIRVFCGECLYYDKAQQKCPQNDCALYTAYSIANDSYLRHGY